VVEHLAIEPRDVTADRDVEERLQQAGLVPEDLVDGFDRDPGFGGDDGHGRRN
jgi:hypothetical protein